MERLTMRNADGIAFWVDPRCSGGGYRMTDDKKDQERLDSLAAYEDAMPLDRAKELAQAEKNGRLVVLPCKVGDEVLVDVRTLPYNYLHRMDGCRDYAKCELVCHRESVGAGHRVRAVRETGRRWTWITTKSLRQ